MKILLRAALLATGVVALGASGRILADEAQPKEVVTKDGTAKRDFSGSDRQMAVKGKALYSQNCQHCHGLNMVTPGTGAYDLRQFPHDDKTRFVTSVTKGKNNLMPAWGDILKPEDIDLIWAYVLTGGKG